MTFDHRTMVSANMSRTHLRYEVISGDEVFSQKLCDSFNLYIPFQISSIQHFLLHLAVLGHIDVNCTFLRIDNIVQADNLRAIVSAIF